MDKQLSLLIQKFLQEIEGILYLQDKFNDRNMAEMIFKLIENHYDL
jgi:hypothetical protein